MSDDFYIVSSKKYRLHKTLEGAQAELARVSALHPDRKPVIDCVTRWPGSRSYTLEGTASEILQALSLLPDDQREDP
jgi:hypothetical protein